MVDPHLIAFCIKKGIKTFSVKYRQRLTEHPNVLTNQILVLNEESVGLNGSNPKIFYEDLIRQSVSWSTLYIHSKDEFQATEI